jgi:hypothetical protein
VKVAKEVAVFGHEIRAVNQRVAVRNIDDSGVIADPDG